MRFCSTLFFAVVLTIFSGCNLDESEDAPLLVFSTIYDFNDGEQGWLHGFADYPAGPEDSTLYELTYAYTEQPGESRKSLMLSGRNLNEDLFMYLKKEITGLKPDTDYTITFSVEMASDHTNSATGGGGSSESVYLKAGATLAEPITINESGYYLVNIDKGNQAAPGQDMTTLGEVVSSGSPVGYTVITRSNTMSNSRYIGRSNNDGVIWLIIGTDSGLQGKTTLYYTKIKVYFSAS